MASGTSTTKRPRSLRRSTSVASLPTPPRTTHKRKRGRRALHQSEDEDQDSSREHDSSSDEESNSQEVVKRRKLALDDEDDADAFWLGGDPFQAADGEKDKKENDNDNDNEDKDNENTDTEDAPLVLKNFRRRTSSQLASPPPSFRAKPTPATLASTSATLGTPPSTPPRKLAVLPELGPVRDSPSNPFLDSPLNSDEEFDDSYDPATSLREWNEKPTMTYIYRGTKRVFNNPHYDPETGKAKPLNPNSLLDPSHPEYEPDFRAKPCVLFRTRKKNPAEEKEPVAGSLLREPATSTLKKVRKATTSRVEQAGPSSLTEEVFDRYFSRIASSTPV